MMASRGMGAIAPSKMPSGKEKARRDDTDFKQFKKGGLAKQAATAIAMKAAGKKPKKMAAGGELKEVPDNDVGLSKLPTEVRNKMGYMKKGGEIWDKPRPKSLGKSKKLSSAQKASAKASAKAAGRPYPNLIDNMKASKK
jgi:hypothetical protein